MNNKVAVVTSTYPNYDADQAMKGISAAGFKYVDLATCPGFFEHIQPRPEEMREEDYKKVLDKVASYKLTLLAVSGHTRMGKPDTVENLKKVIDFTSKGGVSHLITDTGEVKDKKDEDKFYSDISELADYAKSKKVIICIEMHGNWCNTGSRGAEIIKKISHPSVKLNYDTSNVIFYGGVRPEEDIEAALPHMGYLHLKDHGSGKKSDWNFPALGEGVLDFDSIFEKIKDYSGPIDVEVEFDGKEHSLEEINNAVSKSFDFLKDYAYV
jgi:L-ribulose-5-phosphate 3-epimerase